MVIYGRQWILEIKPQISAMPVSIGHPTTSCSRATDSGHKQQEDFHRRVKAKFLSSLNVLKEERQTACKPGSVPPAGAGPRAGMAIPLGRPLPSASCDRPERRREGSPGIPQNGMPAAPTWSCSRWGFPCRRRCRRRGALLPHRFTLAARPVFPGQTGGVLSVALSLGSPPPGVTRHRTSVEPGLSSPRRKAESGHPAVWH